MKVKDLLFTQFNYYHRVNYSTSYNDITLSDWIDLSYDYKDKVENIRLLRIRNQPYKELKTTQLPCVTITGHYLNTRKKGYEDRFNPIIAIDIDSNDNPDIDDWEQIKEKVMQLPYIFFSSLSCSGSGVFCLACIDLSVVKTYHDIASLYSSIEEEFKTKLNLIIDKNCSDSTRTRFLSYDGDYIIKSSGQEIEEYSKKSVTTHHFIDDRQPESPTDWKWSDDFTYKAIYHLITIDNYQSNDYGSWLSDCWRLCWLGEKGHTLFMMLSEKSDKYDLEAAEYKFSSCYKDLDPYMTPKSSLSYYFGILKKIYGSEWINAIKNYNPISNITIGTLLDTFRTLNL